MLDDLETLNNIDKSDMLEILRKFPDQILEVATALKDFELPLLTGFEPNKIVILGMGGSAIGGEMLAALLTLEAKIPIITIRDYVIPASVDEQTLVFACSYSGNTEETLSAVNFALERNSKIIGITSGGKLEELCMDNQLPIFSVPKGYSPRAATVFLFLPMPVLLEKLKLITIDVELTELINALIELRDALVPEVLVNQNPGKTLANRLNNCIPVIYGHSYLTVIAQRWRTQLNENAKMLAFAAGFPEMNHNEIVGWSEATEEITKQFKVVILRSSDEHPQVSKRIELTKKTLVAKAGNVYEVDAIGASKLTRMLTTMYLGDFISVYLALLRGIDPTPVTAIEELKKQLID